MSAAVTLLGSTFNTTSGTHTVVATPAVGDLIVIIRANTGNTTSTAPTDGGGTYSLVTSALKATSVDLMEVWVRTALVASAVSTTYSDAAGTTTGGGLAVYKITGMSVAGLSAIRQSAVQANQAASTTPTPVLGSTSLTTNPLIGAVFNATSAATMTPRTSWTEDVDVGYSTPTTGFESMHRNSGETSTSIAWGSTSASAFCSVAIEFWFDTAPTVALNTPADTGTVTTATPQLAFTGTDADGEAITYEVQVDTLTTFDSSGIAMGSAATDRATSSNVAVLTLLNANGAAVSSGTIKAVTVWFNTAATGVKIGTFFGSGTAWTNRAFANIGSVAAGSAQTFTGLSIAVQAGDLIGIHSSAGIIESDVSPNALTFVGDAFDGASHTFTASGSGSLTTSMGAVGAPSLDKLSASDTGFTDITNGAHTDPFTSGEQIGYTTTSLSNGTYYWRVRGKDPSGTNTFGAWSATRSFTVSVSGGGPPTSGQFFAFF